MGAEKILVDPVGVTTGEGEVHGGGIHRIHASIIARPDDNGCQARREEPSAGSRSASLRRAPSTALRAGSFGMDTPSTNSATRPRTKGLMSGRHHRQNLIPLAGAGSAQSRQLRETHNEKDL